MKDKVSVIFEGLNPQQSMAVAKMEGPVLIVAGAGSGKTRVLTCRIANIIANGVEPSRILALTFTKKAAAEMKDRIADMVGRRVARGIVMGTFHSVFIRFLRDYAEFLGYPREFTIYDTMDSASLIKTCVRELGLDDNVYKPKNILGRISDAKNSLVTPAAYVANQTVLEKDRAAKMPRLCEVYDLYWRKCRASGVMDFDDILFEMNILLRDNPAALEEVSSRFDHILVDEYQDTNRAQYIILKKLAAKHSNICVVGDDSQSIYAFRGARIENILNFKRDYPDCATFRLEQNYRSTQTIVNAANSLISHNENRIPKTCFSQAEEGERIGLVKAYTEDEESALVVGSLMGVIRRDGAEYRDFAILYRTNAQSRALENALRRRNIPYLIYSGNSFYERMEVKDMMAYFKLAVNPDDDESFKRIVNKPARGIGDVSLNALSAAALAGGTSLMKAAFGDDLEQYGLRDAAVAKIRDFCGMMSEFNRKMPVTDAYELAMEIARGGGLYQFFKADMSVEGQGRMANVEELCNSVKTYVEQREAEALEEVQAGGEDMTGQTVTLSEYLENVALLSAVDIDEDEDSSNKVSLMTAHSSKGLEFPYVYIVGMEENLFPSGGQMGARPSEIEEERRLFYVAMTRAMKRLTLSFASTRMRNGRSENNPVSRFVGEIDRTYIENPEAAGMKQERAEQFWQGLNNSRVGSLYGNRGPSGQAFREKKVQQQTARPAPGPTVPLASKRVERVPDENFEPSPISDLRPGQRVEHNRFGLGLLLKIEDDGKVRIEFDECGEKTLLLKFAKIRIV